MSKIEGISSPQKSTAISVVKIATVNGFYKLLFMNFNILFVVAPSQSNLQVKPITSVNISSYLMHTTLRGLNVKTYNSK